MIFGIDEVARRARAQRREQQPQHEARRKFFLHHRRPARDRRGNPFLREHRAGEDELHVRRRRLRRDDFLEARRAVHDRTALRRIAHHVLAADRAGKFEFAHGFIGQNISQNARFGNALFHRHGFEAGPFIRLTSFHSIQPAAVGVRTKK